MRAKRLGRLTGWGVVALAWGVGLGWTAAAQGVGAQAQARSGVAAVTVKADGDKGLAGESPLDTPGVPDPKDVSREESPVAVGARGVWIRANTRVTVRLTQGVSSGVVRNGDTLSGVLAAPVTASNGSVLRAGTPVKATVLSVAKAGLVESAGVLSLQVIQVGGLAVTSDVLEFAGQEGKREVADANPEPGTEATVQAGTALQFEVLGPGDAFDTGAGSADAAGGKGGSVTVGAGTVSAPGTAGAGTTGAGTTGAGTGFARPAAGATTAIHGVTTPH